MNLCREMKLKVNLSWFRLYELSINNLKSKWSREIAQAQDVTTAFIDEERNLLPEIKKIYNEILPVHHDCNPNDQENSHKLKIRAAFSKNRKMNFRLEIKLTVNSSWFREAMSAKHKQSEIRMVRRNSTNASSDNCLYRWGENFTFWNKFVLIRYCQYTWLQSEWSREFA